MTTNASPAADKTFSCETCPMRKKAEINPKSFWSRLWRWHTTWCPGWKAYQAHLAEQAKS
jgi:hypothetical protein